MPRDVVKCLAVWRRLFFEKTLFDEFRDGLCNFRRPPLDAGVEHPPMQDAVDGILCLRMSGQIIQNFWCGRWKWRIGRHAFGMSIVLLKQMTCLEFPRLRAPR